MIGRLYEVVIDCPDPRGLAAFYRELTGLDELLGADDWVTVGRAPARTGADAATGPLKTASVVSGR